MSAPPAGAANWWDDAPRVVDADEVAAFAKAIGDPKPSAAIGAAVPATFPVVLGWSAQNLALSNVLPEDALGLHGEQSFEYLRPIRVGSTVTSRARLESVRARRTGSTVTVRTETSGPEGLAVVQHFTIFVVGRQLEPRGVENPMSSARHAELIADNAPLTGERIDELPLDAPDLYAKASGDTYRIHLDDEIAAGFGLPGRIMHGMCTFGYAARAVQEFGRQHGQTVLTSLAGRFNAPVHPGASLRTVIGGQSGERVLDMAFQCLVGGTPVITRGRALATAGIGGNPNLGDEAS
jgi:acyl dehydratase